MKLAGFGLIVGALGLILGVDGLLFAGWAWIVTGLLVRALVHKNENSFTIGPGVEAEIGRIEGSKGGSRRLGVAGIFLLLISGLGSIAIGALSLGFSGDHEDLRWLPVGIGAIITLIGLVSIPVELGLIKAESTPAGSDTDTRTKGVSE